MAITTQEVSTMLASIGLPYAYYQFPDHTEQSPPFLCFYYPRARDLHADNQVYIRANALTIELYTNHKDFDLERKVETALTAHGLTYAREETYLDSERMYLVIYQTVVLLDESDGTTP